MQAGMVGIMVGILVGSWWGWRQPDTVNTTVGFKRADGTTEL